MVVNRKCREIRTFETGTSWDDPRTGHEKAEAFKVQQLAGGFITSTTYDPSLGEHKVTVEVY